MVEIVSMSMEERPKNTPIVKKYFIYHRLNAGVPITLWSHTGRGWGPLDARNISIQFFNSISMVRYYQLITD